MAGKSDLTTTEDWTRSLCSLAVWSDTRVSLRLVNSHMTLPTLAHVVSGRYRGIAPAAEADNSKHHNHHHHHHHHHHASSRQTSSVVFIQSVRASQKVLMEAVKVQPNGRHVVSTGHNYSMPVTYGGWFEVMSEDGKAIEPVPTVAELAALWPAECVVREAVRAIVYSNTKHSSTDQLHASATRLDQTRTVAAGELLILRDVVEATVETPSSRVDEMTSGGPAAGHVPETRQYLRCVDAAGDHVFLAMNQRALLSPVAGPHNISGVHSLQSLLDKFRLPLIVRLVCGVIPTKLAKTFTSVFRLIGVYEDETAFVLPLQAGSSLSDARMLSVSTREPLVFVGAANIDVVRQSPAFAVVERRCAALVRSYMTSIHVLVAAPDLSALARGTQLLRDTQDTQNRRYDESPITPHDDQDDERGLIYDEIDDIYRYVRQGGDPPTTRSRSTTEAVRGGSSVDTARSAGAHLAVAAQQNAADYNWEEPIYEDIEKIRQRKRQRATMASETTTEMTATTMATTTTTLDDQDKQDVAGVIPIGNLRQLIKRFSMLESSSTSNSKPKPRPAKVDRAPPVPRKLTVDASVTSAPLDQTTDQIAVEYSRPVDVTTNQPSNIEYVEHCVSLEMVDDTEPVTSSPSAEPAPPSVSQSVTSTDEDSYSTVTGVTSIRVSDCASRRRPSLHDATAQTSSSSSSSPYYCSRVAVGGARTALMPPVQPFIVDTQTTVTRITTLGRQSARSRDRHESTA